MVTRASWRLHPRISLVPVAEFPPAVRAQLGGDADHVVLVERGGRTRSQRLDRRTAAFVEQFRNPCTLAEAIAGYARSAGEDPQSLVDSAYALATELVAEGVLVDPDAPLTDLDTSTLGEVVLPEGYRDDVTVVRANADTVLCRVVGDSGTTVAVKAVRRHAPEALKQALRREGRLLARATERGVGDVPALVTDATDALDPALVMQWRPGRRLSDVAAADCSLDQRRAIARALVSAFARLHRTGILHGDVQPYNVLVTDDAEVSLVDLGGGSADGLVPEQRIGYLPHLEPEAAAEQLAGRPAPLPSDAGEQYAVAALLYLVLTGADPISLSLERDTALAQIATQRPRPLAELGVHWPSLQAVLDRALAKDPSARFPDLAAFHAAALAALDATAPLAGRESKRRAAAPEETLRGLVGLGALDRPLRPGPTASVYYGAAGIALALLTAAVATDDGELLAAADVWASRAESASRTAAGFVDESIGLGAERVGRWGVLAGRPGVAAVRALVAGSTGDDASADAATKAFVRLGSQAAARGVEPSFRGDLVNGVPGLLVATAALYDAAPGESARAVLRRLGDRLDARLAAEREPGPLAPGTLLGMAHGVAGGVFASLRWAAATGTAPREWALDALDRLALLVRRDGEAASYPISVDGPPGWPGWCHGSAGHVLTWCLAAEATGVDGHRDLAAALARGLVARGPAIAGDGGLCCGSAGVALALATAARVLDDATLRRHARALAAAAVQQSAGAAVAHSLYRGRVGALLVSDLLAADAEPVWPLLHAAG